MLFYDSNKTLIKLSFYFSYNCVQSAYSMYSYVRNGFGSFARISEISIKTFIFLDRRNIIRDLNTPSKDVFTQLNIAYKLHSYIIKFEYICSVELYR